MIDEESFEDGLVELAADFVTGGGVCRTAIGEERDAAVHRGFDVLEDHSCGRQALLGDGQLAGDAILFFFEELDGDRSGVVGLEKLASLFGEGSDAAGGPAGLLGVAFACGGKLVGDRVGQGSGVGGRDRDLAPLLFDVCFDDVDGDRSLGAGGEAPVAAEAEEVQVFAAVTVLGFGDAQPAPATAAEHAAFEVVVMDPLFLAGQVVGVEHLLHLIERGLFDDGRMRTGMPDALPGDDARVVRVAEHAVHGRTRQRLLGDFLARHGRQPLVGERLGERGEAPVAGGVRVERPLDKRRAGLVDLNGARVVSGDDGADV